jgi:predicted ATPase
LGAEVYGDLINVYHSVVEVVAGEVGGTVVDRAGDGLFAVFPTASQALWGARRIIAQLRDHEWPAGARVRPRIGIHSGEAYRPSPGDIVSAEIHRAARMAQAAWGGQILVSETAWELARDALDPAFGVRDMGRHRLKGFDRPAHLFQLTHPRLDDRFPALRTVGEGSNNLPIQLTSFIGRDEELHMIAELLTSTRMLTLVGPGGSGKTRLALEAAARVGSKFPDGVWLVDLAPLTSPDHVAMAVARPLGIGGEPGRPPESVLVDYLAGENLLLIIDNCEHLIEKVSSLVTELVTAAPGLHVLATSREPLGIKGETTLEVRTLPCPDPIDLVDLEEFDAVRLFLDRAKAASPRLALDEEELRAVGQITCRLDGMPLALELAAALVRVYPPRDLAGLLNDRFDLLASSDPSRPARHQTLRAAVAYSYALLSDEAQVLFRRLSVFRGGFDLDALRQVCGFDPLEDGTVHRVLRELVDKSLVTLSEGGDRTRYRLLETLREFGHEQLTPAENREVRQHHAAFFRSLANRAGSEIPGPDAGPWFRRLSSETDNLRKALRWLFAEEPVHGVGMAVSLAEHWDAVGPLMDAHEWLHRAVELSHLGGPALEISARLAASDLFVSSHSTQSTRYAQEAAALAADSGDEMAQAKALRVLGWSIGLVGRYEEARRQLDESYARLSRLDNPRELAWSLERLGQVEYRDPARSIDFYRQSLALYRQVGDRRRASMILYKMASRSLQTSHNNDEAESWVRESLAVSTDLGCVHDHAHALLVLGRVLRRADRLTEAQETLELALDQHLRLGDDRCAARSAGALGVVLCDLGDREHAIPMLERSLRFGVDEPLERLVRWYSLAGLFVGERPYEAAVLFGAAERLNEEIQMAISENASLNRAGFVAAASDALGEEDFAAAVAEGRTLGVTEAIDHALAMITVGLDADPPGALVVQPKR